MTSKSRMDLFFIICVYKKIVDVTRGVWEVEAPPDA